jgi:uncharacterized membrane protein
VLLSGNLNRIVTYFLASVQFSIVLQLFGEVFVVFIVIIIIIEEEEAILLKILKPQWSKTSTKHART